MFVGLVNLMLKDYFSTCEYDFCKTASACPHKTDYKAFKKIIVLFALLIQNHRYLNCKLTLVFSVNVSSVMK